MKSYKEFKDTYKNLIKKSYDITNLFNSDYKIILTVEKFEKYGTRWKTVSKEEKTVDVFHYCNIFDAVDFFRNLGGYEKTSKTYTIAGYIPTEQVSISPDRKRKSIYSFYITR